MKSRVYLKKILGLIFLVAAFLIVASFVPNFLTISNLLNVVRQSSIIGICAVGMTLVIIIKGIDLSISGLLAFSPMVSGILMLHGHNIFFSLAAGILVGLSMGFFNGLMVSTLSVPAFITTLVVGQVSEGLSLIMNGGRSIGGFPDSYVFLGNGTLFGIPISDYLMLIFFLIGFIILKFTSLGNHILALGGNETVLRQEGISVTKIQFFVYVFASFCTSVAGLLLSAQLDTVHPIQGEAYQLDSIAACVIGGVDMAGGYGSVSMAMVGALIIGSLRNSLNLLGVHPFMQNIFVGIIIISIVFITGRIRQRNRKATRGVL
ncbi:MAG: Ribose transport system permease protein RbsC [Spirochaetes bacterium ADurb.Bin110]|nr:MAG: Ribose transport system permease protein RbsC [Spirochaetes bacterium ADurb.Bin110]